MRRPLLLAFLLVLYLGPSTLAMSIVTPGVSAEPTMTKDFITSYAWSDVLYFATDGDGVPSPTGDYTDTHVQEQASMFNLDVSSPYEASITLEFALPDDVGIEIVHLSFYGYTFTGDLSATIHELLVYNGTHWNDFGDIAENNFGWTNVTLDSQYLLTPYPTVYMKVHVVDDSVITLLADYAEIHFAYTLSEWDFLEEAELSFIVPYDMVGVNMLLIFLGLCLLPASTLYLVRGGKSGMSQDKFFYGLIAFIMGWALFIAGIS